MPLVRESITPTPFPIKDRNHVENQGNPCAARGSHRPYVYRRYTYTQQYGPYDTQAEAEAQCEYLDANRNFGTWFYGVSWWEKQVNPLFFRASRSPVWELQLYFSR